MAFEKCQQSLEKYEEIDFKEGKLRTSNTIALKCLENHDYINSLNYFFKYLEFDPSFQEKSSLKDTFKATKIIDFSLSIKGDQWWGFKWKINEVTRINEKYQKGISAKTFEVK